MLTSNNDFETNITLMGRASLLHAATPYSNVVSECSQ